jgi:hypothetical protein
VRFTAFVNSTGGSPGGYDNLPSEAPLMADSAPCPHAHTQLIAEDEHEKYVECLDCGAILEAGEMKNPSSFPESLSDA